MRMSNIVERIRRLVREYRDGKYTIDGLRIEVAEALMHVNIVVPARDVRMVVDLGDMVAVMTDSVVIKISKYENATCVDVCSISNNATILSYCV